MHIRFVKSEIIYISLCSMRRNPFCVVIAFVPFRLDSGGLTAVIYTDTLCTFLMVVGSLTVMGLGKLNFSVLLILLIVYGSMKNTS